MMKLKKAKIKRTFIATLCSLTLMQPAVAWVDGVAAAQRAAEFLATTAQRGLEIAHWAQDIQNWKDNLQNMLRAKISEFFGIQLSKKMSQEELTRIWEKGRKRCNQISNSLSKSYCNEMITLEIEKIKLYFEGENSIDSQWKQFSALRERYNRAQSPNANNSGELQSISDNMQKVLGKIEIDMKHYEQRIALLDTRIEWLRKARVKITQEQLQGTNRTIVDNISKAAVTATLHESAHSSREKAEELRKANKRRSQEAFQRNM